LRILMVGQGELAYYLARRLSARKHRVTVVIADHHEASALAQRLNVNTIAGDGTDMQVLDNGGARRADAVLALTPHDEDNLAICQMAKGMFGVPRTLALVNDPDNEEIFHQLQVSVAISATRILSTIFQEEAVFEQIAEIMALAEGKVAVSEVHLDAQSPALDRPLQDLDLPRDALIGGIIRQGHVIVPCGSTRLLAGDRLILIATAESLEAAMARLAGAQR